MTPTFVFFFDLCRPVLENANVRCEHHHLLPSNPFLMFTKNVKSHVTCEQSLTQKHTVRSYLGLNMTSGFRNFPGVSTPFHSSLFPVPVPLPVWDFGDFSFTICSFISCENTTNSVCASSLPHVYILDLFTTKCGKYYSLRSYLHQAKAT